MVLGRLLNGPRLEVTHITSALIPLARLSHMATLQGWELHLTVCSERRIVQCI